MRELAGKLEGINAARLDTRIDIKTTQDELKGLAQAINQMLDRSTNPTAPKLVLSPTLPMNCGHR